MGPWLAVFVMAGSAQVSLASTRDGEGDDAMTAARRLLSGIHPVWSCSFISLTSCTKEEWVSDVMAAMSGIVRLFIPIDRQFSAFSIYRP
ncbi:hypothetical protein, partial [Aeromonas caviae]|uniref:hypothetical protein n=1 Tax=Aeromonas caviae TaxID=648 RepID=UPI001C87E55A